MIIEVNMKTLLLGILIITAIIALTYLIVILIKVGKLVDNLNKTIEKNKTNLDNTLKNINDISENVRDISDVALETTAEAIILKEGLFDKVDIVKDIVNIASSVFLKK
ncbi:DUF948 domain-containing protein [Clostridium gasigenes]|uniref:Uncharacterized protein n=1 Tax=Clostridium gasigenes TaxID=94869 RepID=A0A1H0NMV5_9CLOT|nr:DUF948 domain-containing protein [Clostridium gasigenes]MBB6623638.1 hypothetical protein [Clostridium gasigenes]MBU3087561.1 DUF948 domain-containing protein [Clostridium gasigenes]MBU3105364.1 DUF948 domain-containing protein [Clostridium gasigenes]MBU3135236.1 DUF948 domain-containing protein [Clostridium gasigenes]NKF05527.1 DUF948 domain-containing protein [Clostridium gasigenes]